MIKGTAIQESSDAVEGYCDSRLYDNQVSKVSKITTGLEQHLRFPVILHGDSSRKIRVQTAYYLPLDRDGIRSTPRINHDPRTLRIKGVAVVGNDSVKRKFDP